MLFWRPASCSSRQVAPTQTEGPEANWCGWGAALAARAQQAEMQVLRPSRAPVRRWSVWAVVEGVRRSARRAAVEARAHRDPAGPRVHRRPVATAATRRVV